MKLPLPDSPLREMFDAEEVVLRWHELPSFVNAVRACRNTVANMPVRSAQAVCIRANAEIWLIQVGKRGGIKRLWNFGKGRRIPA